MTRTWHVQDKGQSLVLASAEGGLPEVVYWGPPLPADSDLAAMAQAHRLDVTGGMLDQVPPLSICPEAARSFPGQPGLTLRDENGELLRPLLLFETAEDGRDELMLSYRDAQLGLTYRAHFRRHETSQIIEAWSEIESTAAVRLDWLAAPVLPAPQLADEMMDFSGRWVGEFQANLTPWTAGIRLRESRTGRTGHEHFPGLILPCRGTTNTGGEAYALHYGWSGGHRMVAEELPDGRRQIQFGHAAGSELGAGRYFRSAPLFATYSDAGLNGCAVAFQRHLRDVIVPFPDPPAPRPVHYNCWEAVYFDHDLETLRQIASRAADLGAERFVLDDGWFGDRDDDRRALGDWEVDHRKYPDGLDPLIRHVRSLGMEFGLWFEPEMVNPDSAIYRAHPDWVLGPADQPQGRQQLVLDMAQSAVQEHLYNQIAALLTTHRIDYIKWDHNRVLPYPDAAQTRATYALVDWIRAEFPQVEIESCASGGGRIDFGVLARTHRVWLSDSNDALERLRIQHMAALFLPMVVTGSHVGPRRCHTSGRVIGMELRAWVAAQRHMGFEMDPRELTDAEAETLTRVILWWKDNRDWMARADILRLDSADPSVIAEQQLAEDGARFVVFAGIADSAAQALPRPLRLTRLDRDTLYRVRLVNAADVPALSRGAPALKSGAIEVSGQYLMHHGITLPWQFPLNMWVIEGHRL